MSKTEQARDILRALEVPRRQQSDLCCLTLLAMADIREDDPWEETDDPWMRIHDILLSIRDRYGKEYAENSRETIRKQALHPFRDAAFVEDNGRATNSPGYRWRLTEEMRDLLRTYGTPEEWETSLSSFKERHRTLEMLYASRRDARNIPVTIGGIGTCFSPGRHNRLQKAVLEEFAPRFVPDPVYLYVGDTVKKDLYKDEERLGRLGFSITLHDKMLDVVLYSLSRDWLFFVEAVTSVGPMDPKRILELEAMTVGVTAGKIYVSAFPDFKTYRRFSGALAWETEVWIAEFPGHLIHLDGDRFLGPR